MPMESQVTCVLKCKKQKKTTTGNGSIQFVIQALEYPGSQIDLKRCFYTFIMTVAAKLKVLACTPTKMGVQAQLQDLRYVLSVSR